MIINVAFADDHVLIGKWQNLLVVDIAGTLELPHLERVLEIRRALESAAAAWVSLSFVRVGAGAPDAPTRKAANSAMKEVKSAVAVVNVMEASGITGVALRTIVRTMNTLSGVDGKIVASLDEALPVILPHMAGKPEAKTVRDALAAFRRRLRSKG